MLDYGLKNVEWIIQMSIVLPAAQAQTLVGCKAVRKGIQPFEQYNVDFEPSPVSHRS